MIYHRLLITQSFFSEKNVLSYYVIYLSNSVNSPISYTRVEHIISMLKTSMIFLLSLFPALLVGLDVSKRKDGGIRKSTLVKGNSREIPNDGATCEGNITVAHISKLESIFCFTIVICSYGQLFQAWVRVNHQINSGNSQS